MIPPAAIHGAIHDSLTKLLKWLESRKAERQRAAERAAKPQRTAAGNTLVEANLREYIREVSAQLPAIPVQATGAISDHRHLAPNTSRAQTSKQKTVKLASKKHTAAHPRNRRNPAG